MKFWIKATLNHEVIRRKFDQVLLFSHEDYCDF